MDESRVQAFAALLVCGALMIGAEVFIPGGVLGLLGGIAILIAMAMSFYIFEPIVAGYVCAGIVLLVGLAVVLWIRYFPRSPIGRKMTVATDLGHAGGTEAGLDQLLGATGITTSDLHPGGFAEINGERIDVISEGEMIPQQTPIIVVNVEGNRVIVETQESAPRGGR
jgi:membrane-bound serine protease (ClpP class)